MPKRTVYAAEVTNGDSHETWTVVAPNKTEAKKKLEFLSGLNVICLSPVATHCAKRHWKAG